MDAGSLISVQVGRVAPLMPEGVPSGFRKTSVRGPVDVGTVGLDGDEQADLQVHGGPEKAVYGYPFKHYSAWLSEFPEHREKLIPGGFGENLTIEGLTEAEVCAGDVHRIGTALLQVCQPRQPCFKLALHFNDNRLPKAMVRTGRAGWYYRVLEPGTLEAGDRIELADRPHPAFSFQRLIEIVNFGNSSEAELREMSTMTGLSLRLRRKAAAALRSA